MRIPGCVLAVAVVAAAFVGSTFGAARSVAGSSRASANEVVARSDAGSLLAGLRLPVGATRSAGEPTGDAGALAHPAVGVLATASEVDESAFWSVRASPQAVLEFVKERPPAGSKL